MNFSSWLMESDKYDIWSMALHDEMLNRRSPSAIGAKQLPAIKNVIFNKPATIVFWADGTKTVVKAMEGEEFSPYYGLVVAVSKKLYGSNSAINNIVKKFYHEETASEIDKK